MNESLIAFIPKQEGPENRPIPHPFYLEENRKEGVDGNKGGPRESI